MDEIEQRLKTCTENCIKAYGAWSSDKKNTALREALQEAVHELRKVAARIEIEVAKSEGGERASNPLPIPPHRSARPAKGDNGGKKKSGGAPRGKSKSKNDNSGDNGGDELPSFISGDKKDDKKSKPSKNGGKLSLDGNGSDSDD
ncbi:MAG: hypothetical protein CMH25_05540 [Micavibrio sp.]|nr:hypothetical protein [Micavibrio sp.]|tara:strand:- start:160 stop:594 length:435 start_codon:yes stop_codon:yes gene_type:complete